MKKKSPPYAIILAVIVGIVGFILLLKWKQGMTDSNAAALAAQKAELEKEIQDAKAAQPQAVVQTDTNMRQVYYAVEPIQAGQKISPALFEKKLTPNDVLPEAYSDGTDLVGFYAIRPIEKGDPLSPHNVGKTLPYLSERIPPGMRAMSLPVFNTVNTVSEGNATGGFAVDGDYVDLLYSNLLGDAVINTQTILQNVQVLFIPETQTRSDATVGIMPAQPRAVTFLVTPEEAQILLYLVETNKSGKFSMILRGRSDKQENKLKPYTLSSDDDLRKIQRKTDQSYQRVDALQKAIEAAEQKEKAQASKGSTNETTAPTPPSP